MSVRPRTIKVGTLSSGGCEDHRDRCLPNEKKKQVKVAEFFWLFCKRRQATSNQTTATLAKCVTSEVINEDR